MSLAGWLRLLGYLLGLCAIVAIVKTAIDRYQENIHSKWRSAVAVITRQSVRQVIGGRRLSGSYYVWFIESELRYRVGGEELTSSIRSRVTQSADERTLMRKWAAQHQAGTSLPVRYDPLHPASVVPDAGDMPETGPQARDDVNLIIIFLLPSIALVATGRALERRRIQDATR